MAQRQQQQRLLQQQQLAVNGPSTDVKAKSAQSPITVTKMNGVCSEVDHFIFLDLFESIIEFLLVDRWKGILELSDRQTKLVVKEC